MTTPADIIAFWTEAGPGKWFKKDESFDGAIRTRFEALHHAAARGECADWEQSPEGALALLLLLDQFPRNLYRGSAHAFATDGLALRIARDAVASLQDAATDMPLRLFFYLPFEHSEHAADQAEAVRLIAATGDADYLRFAQLHADIIARFGRFPHRNAALGRTTTPEEQDFLASGGFAG
ncbi:MAG: DUF924 family protein [Alphaproteobacteria bacterium]|nr:DUF924 family protein [Alphaproteobacteria bacterium]